MFFGGDPFQKFGHHGAGGAPGGPAVDTTKLYETLNIAKGVNAIEIKKAYRKLAVVHHPDKGGDEHKFKEINAAYTILSDPEKRSKYDRFGLKGVEDGAGGGMGDDGEDVFSMFFGGRGAKSRGPRRGEDVNHPLKVSLEDLYNGKTVKLAVNRSVLVGEPKLCTTCDGKGHVVELRQIALGMVQQLQRRCQECAGEGYRCSTTKERRILEVHVERGMKNNEKIVFRGMADEKPNVEAGNINFVVQEQEHELFKRKGADLLIRKTVSLNEALCGFVWKITHLDAREMVIKSKPGEIIRALADGGQPFVKIVKGEGMPSKGNMFVKGNLYVAFTVDFPKDKELSEEVVASLREILPNPSMQVDYDDNTAEVAHLEQADVRNFGSGGAATSTSAYDEDTADGGPQPVQCQQS